jgi:hypothetical protein
MINKSNITTIFDCFSNPNDFVLEEDLLKSIFLGHEIEVESRDIIDI